MESSRLLDFPHRGRDELRNIMTDKIQKITFLMGKYTHLICVNHETLQRWSDIQNPLTSESNDARIAQLLQNPTEMFCFGVNTRTNLLYLLTNISHLLYEMTKVLKRVTSL